MTWQRLTARLGRNDYPYVLFTNWHDLALHEKPQAVLESWSRSEYPERLADRELWVMAFDEVGYQVDFEVMEREDDPDLPDPVTLWRGCTPDRVDGMSWSLDRDRALWFANRWNGLKNGDTGLYRIEIPHEFALARCTGRDENEVIVDTTDFTEEEYLREK